MKGGSTLLDRLGIGAIPGSAVSSRNSDRVLFSAVNHPDTDRLLFLWRRTPKTVRHLNPEVHRPRMVLFTRYRRLDRPEEAEAPVQGGERERLPGSRASWARLLRIVFEVDPLACPRNACTVLRQRAACSETESGSPGWRRTLVFATTWR